MIPSKCPVCGGKLHIKIGAGLAVCESCGGASEIDPAEIEKYRAICRTAERSMQKYTAAGYREALALLEPIGFVDEAEELRAECEERLNALQTGKRRQQEMEQASEKRNTALGVILLVLMLLFVLAALAGAVYLVIRLANGSLPPAALWITVGAAALAVVLIIINKLK